MSLDSIKPFKCRFCNKTFRSEKSLEDHRSTVHKRPTFQYETLTCSSCEILFNEDREMKMPREDCIMATHNMSFYPRNFLSMTIQKLREKFIYKKLRSLELRVSNHGTVPLYVVLRDEDDPNFKGTKNSFNLMILKFAREYFHLGPGKLDRSTGRITARSQYIRISTHFSATPFQQIVIYAAGSGRVNYRVELCFEALFSNPRSLPKPQSSRSLDDETVDDTSDPTSESSEVGPLPRTIRHLY